MIDLLLDLLCCFFLIASGLFIWGWVFARQRLPWEGRQSVKWVLLVLASLIGSWHVIFGIIKLVYVIIWTLTT